MVNEKELAYIAGIFDGEGCASIVEHRQRTGVIDLRMRVVVTNTCLPLLLFLQEKFVSGSIQADRRGKKTCYRWVLDGSTSGLFLEAIQPYLIVKRDVARICLEFRSMKGQGRTERRDQLRTQLRAVNSGEVSRG